jgi:predicted  nucleic acid-binding Zn ribbon protein
MIIATVSIDDETCPQCGGTGTLVMEIHDGCFFYKCRACDLECYTEHFDILQHWDD